ncbi:MAG: Ig-like domain-containing protein [Phaeodactylibacter sp.]|nr:Ig-like domain-containing protein [Phaeodactylibacter sp.]
MIVTIQTIFDHFRTTLQLLALAILLSTCSKEEVVERPLSLLAITANGINLVDGAVNVPVNATFELSFSAALDAEKFESAFSLATASGMAQPGFSYSNATSKVVVSASGLAFNTAYQLKVSGGVLGQNGEVLDKEVSLNFTTVDGGVVTEMEPCIAATGACLETAAITNEAGAAANFEFYSSFPAYQENARWEKLKYAVIVAHGQNRDAGNYFTYLMATLRDEGLEDNTLLMAPFFKSASGAGSGDLHWNTSGWREGQNSDDATGISSFEVVDQLLARLADKAHFPVLEKVIITGHSSGALFTQAYAAANQAEGLYPDVEFHYIVANSQYFYYPDDVRYDESTGQFVEPAGCPAFNHWPLGFVDPPDYLSGVEENTVDQQIVERQVVYLLGSSDTSTSGTLNTADCEAVFLGSNRFKRGEHLYSLMQANHSDAHNSRKIVVNGVGHDAQAMYQSMAFRTLLRELLN